jgi:ribosomal protein S12 methylthiotransferase accessory factor YcaO
MLSIAGLRYRNVLAVHGGPVAKIETGTFSVRGRPTVMANATLNAGLTRKSRLALFSDADGTGVHPVPSIARHKAVSEALERWAFSAMVRSSRAGEFGFDVDPSSNGMSAFPGLLKRNARRSAVLEAIERFSLMAWWDGRAPAHPIETDWPGVSAVAINGPFGGVTVVAWARTEWGGYVYGHAAEESISAACEHAVVELARHEWILRSSWLAVVAGQPVDATNIFERRCLFFASEEGHDIFQQRVTSTAAGAMPKPEILCDREIPGPWSAFATVWRFALRPPSEGYARGGERYFFL